jgi:GNAT superfamily N-acetyltransferase
MSFQIRRAAPADLPSVVTLIRALAEFEKLPGPDDAAAARFTADAAADPPRFELLVAEADGAGAVVGYALFFTTYSTFLARPGLYLEDVFVRPERRGRGIGTAFLRALASLAQARGCGRFEWTVLDWNVDAQRFYRALGAEILPQWQVCRVEGPALERLAR